jgi:cation diffusion facilitator CzcD-associated flavoprotein CzcO
MLTRIQCLRHLHPVSTRDLDPTPVIKPASDKRRGRATKAHADRLAGSEAADELAPVREWLRALGSAVQESDGKALRHLFLEDGYWRDHLALTWNFRTFGGPDLIAAELLKAVERRPIRNLLVEHAVSKVFEHRTRGRTAESSFTFETDIGTCRGHVRLILDPGGSAQWRAWTFFTSLEEIKGHEERAGSRRPRRARHGTPAKADTPVAADPRVLVIGAGHAGVTIAARLKALDVETLVIDREKRIGDNWRNRYQSLILHNETAANHLPFLPFPATWPNYLSKEQMADWLDTYASALGLDVSTSTSLTSATYDSDDRRWTVHISKADGSNRILHPGHIVQATGVFGTQNRLEIEGADRFAGRLIYAGEYTGGIAAAGTRALVVGTGSSGHDVAQDLSEAGAQVTMLQRSSTCVVSVEPGAARAYSIYSDDGLPIQDADLASNSFPFPVVAELHKEMTKRIAEMDRDLLEGLRAAGFVTDFGEDESGFLMKYHRYGGGYYINVGCSELIVSGKIKIKQGAAIDRLEGDIVFFTDGDSMPADLVVIATGYANMSESVRAVMGSQVADRVGPVWGFDQEGEVRAMWRPTGQPGFWLMGGSLQQCRPYSKYLALQIKARELGLV